MNKKFLVVALMATLSTVGYAGEIDQNKLDYVYGKVGDIARETSKNIVNIDRHDKEIGILKDNVNQLENTAKGNKVAIETVMGSVIDLEGKVKENLEIAGQAQNNAANALIQNSKQDKEIENLKTQVGNNTAISTENSKLIGELTTNKADKSEVEDLKTQVERNEQAIQGNTQQIEDLHKQDANLQGQITDNAQAIQGNTQQIVDLNNSKLDKDTYENDKLAQEKRDEEQDGKINNVSQRVDGLRDEMNTANVQQNQKIEDNTIAIDKLDEENKTQNGRLDAVEKENNKQNERLDIVEENAEAGLILAQKNENSISDLYANKVDNSKFEEHKKQQEAKDKDQDDKIQANKDAIEKETADRKAEDEKLQGQIDDFNNKFAGYDGRLSGLEKKVDNLDNKMNKGLSLMAAMNAVDFQNVQTGEMAIGAGVGHYGNAQSVALGVAYSPVQDLTVNAKYSVTAGDVDSFALGAGATYKFKVGR